MSSRILQITKLPIILMTIGILLFGFVCAGMFNHGSMHQPMNIAAVMPADSQQECCNTSISKHVESWKNALLVLPREVKDNLLLFLLGLLTVAFVGLRFRHDPDGYHQISYSLYIRDNPELALFDHLKLAFARGILNPKIY